MKIPDIIGLSYDQAKTILQESGFIIHSVETTSPPRERSSEYYDFYRVIRIKALNENKVELLVCNPGSV